MVVAVAFTLGMALLSLLQLALALGAPWGALAWGGQHSGTLPTRLRVASALSIVIYLGSALLALDLAGIIDLVPNRVSQLGMWIVFGLLALGVLANAFSRSRLERFTMTPAALVLAALALASALSGPVPHTFEGMVLDAGAGPVFCTTVMESYPPQCGRDSAAIVGWDWDDLAHDEQQQTRWGSFRFEGILDGNTLTVTGTPTTAR